MTKSPAKIFLRENRHLVVTERTRGEHREMAFSGSRAGHYAPLSTDGNESSLLSRDEQVRRARVVSRTRPARPRRSRHPGRNECNNEISRETWPNDARNLTRPSPPTYSAASNVFASCSPPPQDDALDDVPLDRDAQGFDFSNEAGTSPSSHISSSQSAARCEDSSLETVQTFFLSTFCETKRLEETLRRADVWR